MVEEVRCKLLELHGVVGSKANSSKVVDVKFRVNVENVVKVTQN